MSNDQTEQFYKNLLKLPVTIASDSKPDLTDREKKPRMIDIALSKTPEPIAVPSTSNTNEGLNLIVKNLKSNSKLELKVTVTSTIKDLKQQIVESNFAPSVHSIRLLAKGKALNEEKLVKDYENISNNSVLTMSLRDVAPTDNNDNVPQLKLDNNDTDAHVQLDSNASTANILSDINRTNYESTLSNYEFWIKLKQFLESEFENEEFSKKALETFFLVSYFSSRLR